VKEEEYNGQEEEEKRRRKKEKSNGQFERNTSFKEGKKILSLSPSPTLLSVVRM